MIAHKQYPARRSHPAVRRGFVLIVILIIVMLMSVAAYGFLVSMQTENLAARTSGDQLVTQQCAYSGIEWAAAMLELPAAQRKELVGKGGQQTLFEVSLGTEQGPEPTKSEPKCLILQPLPADPTELTELPLGMINESGKLNLMTLLEWEKLHPGSARSALLRLPGMTGADANAILDWIDADAQPRAEGAESDAYAQLTTPYAPRNGRPLDLEELLLVRGIDEFRLLGKAGPDTSSSRPTLGQRSPTTATQLPWCEYLTVWSAERNAAKDGTRRVFVNNSQMDQLHRQLAQRLPIDWANFIVLYRQFAPGPSTQQTLEANQITPNFSLPAKRPIASLLDLINVSIVMPHNGTTVTVKSPFKLDPAVMQTQLPLLLDLISIHPEERLEGRINISLAPREVLLALPGVDEGLAERLLGARSMDRTGSAGRDHPAWLLTEGLVDLPAMRKLLPLITVGGDVFRAEFWGLAESTSLMFRCEAVIDASVRPAKPVMFSDLTPLPREVWEELLPESTSSHGRTGR